LFDLFVFFSIFVNSQIGLNWLTDDRCLGYIANYEKNVASHLKIYTFLFFCVLLLNSFMDINNPGMPTSYNDKQKEHEK